MSNRLYIVPCEFHDVRSKEVSFGYRVFDDEELVHLVDSSLDFWLTTGRFADQFEKEFAARFGVRHALLVNSG